MTERLTRLDDDERGGCIVPTPGGPAEVDVDLYRWVKSKEFRRLLGEGIPKYLSDDPAFGLTELAEQIKVPIHAVNWLIDGLLDELRRRDCHTRKTISARAARMARPTPRPTG